MAALTPTRVNVISAGNVWAISGTFTSIANADTWNTGLKAVEGSTITNGASGQTVGATYSGGTITFATSGALANAKVTAFGF